MWCRCATRRGLAVAPLLHRAFTEDWEESARLKLQEQHTFVVLPLFQLRSHTSCFCLGDLWRSLSVNHPRHNRRSTHGSDSVMSWMNPSPIGLTPEPKSVDEIMSTESFRGYMETHAGVEDAGAAGFMLLWTRHDSHTWHYMFSCLCYIFRCAQLVCGYPEIIIKKKRLWTIIYMCKYTSAV